MMTLRLRYVTYVLVTLVFMCTHAPSVLAQTGNTVIRFFPGVPSGTCSQVQVAVNTSNGDFYDCLAGAWHKVGPGAGGSGTTLSVNGSALASSSGDLDDATPSAPANSINTKWQKDALSPTNISSYIPYAAPVTVSGGNLTVSDFTGDAGAGGTRGTVIAPAIGDATKFLRGDATWATVTGSGTTITVNGSALAATTADFDNSTPAAPAGNTNVTWQKDALSPTNISAYIPTPTTATICPTATDTQVLFVDGTTCAGNAVFTFDKTVPQVAVHENSAVRVMDVGNTVAPVDVVGTFTSRNYNAVMPAITAVGNIDDATAVFASAAELESFASHTSGTVGLLEGGLGSVSATGAGGTTTQMYGLGAIVGASAGTILGDVAGLWVYDSGINAASTTTNLSGVYIGVQANASSNAALRIAAQSTSAGHNAILIAGGNSALGPDFTDIGKLTIAGGAAAGKVLIGDGTSFVPGDPMVQGLVAHDAPDTSNPVLVGGYASAAAPTNVSADGDAVNAWFLRNGSQVVNLAAGGTLITATGSSENVNITGGSISNTTFAVTQSTSPWIVAGGGTAGSAASGVVTVQGIASMTPILATATLSAETTKVIGTVRVQGNVGGVMDTTQNAAQTANNLSIGCAFTSSPNTITTGNQGAVNCNSKGELLTQLTDGTTNVSVIAATNAVKTDDSSWAGTALGTPTNFGTTPTAVIAASANASMFVGTTSVRTNQTTTATGVVDVNVVGSLGATNSVTNGTFIKLTDNTTGVNVISGTNALKTDMSSVAGTATSTAASGVQKVGVVGNAGAIFDAATGAAVPANGLYVGGNGSGNMTGFLRCDNSVVYDTNTNGKTTLVASVSGKVVYVCGVSLSTSQTTLVNVSFGSGTGTNCATTYTAKTPAWPIEAPTGVGPTGLVLPVANVPYFQTAATEHLCISTSAGVSVQALVVYTQF